MHIPDKYEESTLLSLLEQDSEYAFQLIFDRYRNNIYKVAMMYVKSPVVAEEIVQDVFLKLWFQRKDLGAIISLRAWLFTLTKNLTLNSLKKIAHEWTAREKWLKQLGDSEDNTDHKLRNAEYRQLLHAAILQLPVQQQQVYQLAREQGLSYHAIGEQMSISPLTVKTHMSRALASIRTYLQHHGDLSVLLIVASIY